MKKTMLKKALSTALAALMVTGSAVSLGTGLASAVESDASVVQEAALRNTSTLSADRIVKGSSVTVKCSAEGGEGKYQYAVYYKRSTASKWTTAQKYDANRKVVVTPSYTGTYTICVRVKDSAGNVEKSYLTLKVVSQLKNTSKLSKSTILKGSTVTLKGYAKGGAGPYSFAFSYKRASSTSWSLAQAYSEANTVAIEPKHAEDYDVRISVKDQMGTVVRKELVLHVLPAIRNSSKLSASTIQKGQSVTVEGAASGGSDGFRYAFYYKKTSAKRWTTAQKYSENASVTITPKYASEYTVRVKAKDSMGHVDRKDMTLTVLPQLKNSSSLSAKTILKGESVTVRGAASGGAGGYQYAYYYKRTTSDNWTTAAAYSDSTEAVITPLAACDYDVRVKVRDAKNNVVVRDLSLTVLPAFVNTSTVKKSVILKGDSVTLSGSAKGGSGEYKFAYYYKRTTQDTWTTASAYTDATSAEITPMAAVDYDVRIRAKDSLGHVEDKLFTVSVLPALENNAALSSDMIDKGDSVDIIGSAKGGSGDHLYAFYYKRAANTGYTTAQAFETNDRVTITPTGSGYYDIRTKVKDSLGHVVVKDLRLLVYTPLKNTSSADAANISIGDTVNITASASGGSEDYTYACFYYFGGVWTRIGGYGTEQSFTFTPESIGTYTVRVKVKDSLGTVVDKDFVIKASEGLTNLSSVDKTEIVKGDSVTMTAAASGGSGEYTYAYYYKQKTQDTWTVVKSYSTAVTATVTPKLAVDYDLRVDVRDSNGIVTSKYFEVSVKQPLKNTTQISDDYFAAGQSVEITASASGGIGEYSFAYYYMKSTDNEMTLYKDYGPETFVSIELPEEGTYYLRTIARDSSGSEDELNFEVNVTGGIVNLSEIDPSTVAVGQTVTMYGDAGQGIGEYRFAFYTMSENDEYWTCIQDTSPDEVAYTTFDQPGKYYILIIALDDVGKSIKTFEVTVNDELSNNSVIDKTIIGKGDSVLVTGAASGGTGDYTYAFSYKQKSQTDWTTVSDYSTKDTVFITPRAAVGYYVRVSVKDSSGVIQTKVFELNVLPAVINESTVSAERAELGDIIVLSASASGGSGEFTYAYYIKDGSANEWDTLLDYSDTTAYEYTAAEIGFYDLKIAAKDSNGIVSEKTFTLSVGAPIFNYSSIDKYTILQGDTVTVNAAAQGGTGEFTFAYYYKQSRQNSWTLVKDFSTDTTATVKPVWNVPYDIRVVARDTSGTEQDKVFNIEVLSKIENNSTISAESILRGEEVILEAAASGSNGDFSYSFFYKEGSENQWNELAVSAAAANIAYFKPTATGTYDLRVRATDSLGNTEDKDFILEVIPAFRNESTISSEAIYVGERVTLTGIANGQSTGYTYAFLTVEPTAAGWLTIQDYSTSNTLTLPYSYSGTYPLRVSIMDSLGNVEDKDFTLTVYDQLSNDSTVSSTSIASDSSIQISGAASGGSGSYTYAYYCKAASDTAWTTIKSFSTDTSATFVPGATGSYTILVAAMDSMGTKAEIQFSVSVFAALQNTSVINKTSIIKGNDVVIRASATGGSKPYSYAYYYKASYHTNWTCAEDFGNTNVLTLTLSSTGNYNFRVDIKDSTGAVSSKYFDVSVRNALDNLSYVDSNTVKLTSELVLHNSYQGGFGTVTFNISVRKYNSNTWTTIASNTTAQLTKYTFNSEGKYELRSAASDSQGNTSEKTFTIEVVNNLFEEKLDEILAQILNPNMDEFMKVKSIHDWMINYADYDTEGYFSGRVPASSYTAEGFLETKKAVCDGYAKMFSALAGRAGLSNIRVTGQGVHDDGSSESHAWNQVKVDGKWYNIDVTWDDPVVTGGTTSDNLRYQYFLVPDKSFSGSHIPGSGVQRYTCTAAQPIDRLVSMEIEKDLAAHPDYAYCETDTQLKNSMQSFYNNGVNPFTIIYKTNETDANTIMNHVVSLRPSGTGARYSMIGWKFSGYYKITITLT